MSEPLYFQWQNEILCRTIYPMREPKLRDFLVYYMEIDIWKQYKDRDIASLKSEVDAYKRAQELAAVTAYKSYSTFRKYFFLKDVRYVYLKFKPLDETELAEINNFHAMFIDSWPKDIRGERSFVESQVTYWTQHRNTIQDWIKSRKRRLDAMAPDHEKRPTETKELVQKETVSLPMAEQELDQLHALLATYDRIEKPKLEWYRLQKNDPNFQIPEADFLVRYVPNPSATARDIASWKVEEYKAGLEKKDQFELLEEIYQRFSKDPKRYPLWLQYMIVHFSGMRYASAHGSWADPKDLLIRLRSAKADEALKKLDATAIEKLSAEKVAAYEGTSKPKMALTQEKEWKDKVAINLSNLKSTGPQTRRYGLTSMQADEIAYEIKSMTTAQALETLKSMKDTFSGWAWKEIVKLTPLRVTEVTDPDWEKLTPEEEAEKNAQMYTGLGKVVAEWENYDVSAWREEHGRTHELIVSRAVCNETAEHIQHIRGHLPPGGLTPKPKWYLDNESANILPGTPHPYYVKATSEKDYTPGASILWLRFVDKEPNAWQIAKMVQTKNGIGLLPDKFQPKSADNKNISPWVYKKGEVITRSRTLIGENKQKTVQQQWLRWIHEATVVEVAETAEGTIILTYETALPDDYKGTSSIGMFKKPLEWFLSDGTEDEYNRSFVGFVPEGQVPVEHLKTMLDWNTILRKKVA
jgi:hypothetical protein